MKCAFNSEHLRNLVLVQECRRWAKDKWISSEQLQKIREAFPSPLYHPNFVIRLLLFFAGTIALSGVVGLLALMFMDAFEHAWEFAALILAAGALFFLEQFLIVHHHHFKSGVNEAMLYFAELMIILGLGEIVDFNEYVLPLICLLVFAVAAMRYLDLLNTLAAFGALTWCVFVWFNGLEGAIRFAIPFVMIILFTPLYFLFRSIRNRTSLKPWHDCLLVAEAASLALIYLSGNYLVVRELAQSMMHVYLEPGEDIPFAFIFYGLTLLLPLLFVVAGIRTRNVVLLRIGLLAVAFTVFTFKYYFSLGHPEITFTVVGLILIGLSLWIFFVLKKPRNGFVREALLSDKWSNAQLESFAISQTMGGNKVTANDQMKFGGGSFGGGGSGGQY